MECEGMSQQEQPREDRREAKARDLSNACRPSQSKDMLDTRPQKTATSREAVQQEKETMLHPMQKIDVEASHTLHKTRRIQQFNNSKGSMRKDMLSQQVESYERSQIQTMAVAQLYEEKERERREPISSEKLQVKEKQYHYELWKSRSPPLIPPLTTRRKKIQ